jgi:hypothetical protein
VAGARLTALLRSRLGFFGLVELLDLVSMTSLIRAPHGVA